jgi:hypothetical protein
MQSKEGQCIRLCVQSDSGAKNKGHSKLNIKQKKELTKSSVRLQEWSTDLYSSARRPKAPDKYVRRTDNGGNREHTWSPENDAFNNA